MTMSERKRFRVKRGRAKSDPEKAVLPTIIFAEMVGVRAKVRAIAFGWWDFHITVLWSRAKDNPHAD
jgi:hypothetical protein